MTPYEAYEADLSHRGFTSDPQQAQAMRLFDSLYHRLRMHLHRPKDHLLSRLVRRAQPAMPQGIYLWGGVGVGKTYLMDKFYDALGEIPKRRLHFHRFMREIHAQLTQRQGQKDPLRRIAKRWSKEIKVLCLDEFFVSDITDAMILAGLLEGFFSFGVLLVTTSNLPPPLLYQDGLQRARFLPAIDLLLKHTQVIELKSAVDFRLRTLEQAELYHSPLDEVANQNMSRYFQSLAPNGYCAEVALEIDSRVIQVQRLADDVLWASFDALCGDGRSQRDYIEISKMFHAVLISDVPQFTPVLEDKARRFILMVDEFYDRQLKLIIAAAVPIKQLYRGHRLLFEFERTQSRLIEMQSHAYLAKPHQP